MKKKIIIISNTAWYLYNFRGSLMTALRDRGHLLLAVAPADEYVDKIKAQGFSFASVAINRKGINPLEDILLIFKFIALFKKEKPDLILTYTPKPNIYASMAAAHLHIPVISNVAGLGNAFIDTGIITLIVKQLYRYAFLKCRKVFFQNNDDLNLFVEQGLVKRDIAERLPGSGVDTDKFAPQSYYNKMEGEFVFLLIARMLWDKGVGEFVEAARLLKSRYPQTEYRLVGFLDPHNPSGISGQQIKLWTDEDVVIYEGGSDNIIEFLHTADCVVLPSSYREGVPRVLLEAASMAKPVITTDTVGCRDAVDDGVTGFLCKAKNARDLAEKMERLLQMSEEDRELMGKRGREKMTREFDERYVIQRYIDVIEGR